jgi:hypothetical protein
MIRLKVDPDGFFLLLPTPYAPSNRLFQISCSYSIRLMISHLLTRHDRFSARPRA